MPELILRFRYIYGRDVKITDQNLKPTLAVAVCCIVDALERLVLDFDKVHLCGSLLFSCLQYCVIDDRYGTQLRERSVFAKFDSNAATQFRPRIISRKKSS